MEAVLDVSNIPEDYQEYIPMFADGVLEQILTKLMDKIPRERLTVYCEELPYQRFVKWRFGPKKVSCEQMLSILSQSVIYNVIDGKLIFKPNEHKNFPTTFTNMSQIFKFLSYGNGLLRGIHQIQDVFNEFDEDMIILWNTFMTNILEEEERANQ